MGAVVNLWRVQCSTDSNYYTVWSTDDTEPTVCPNNAAHTIVADSGRIIKSIRQSAPRLDHEDGRLMVAPVIHPDYMNPYFCSISDDFDNGLRGEGEFMSFEFDNTAPVSNTFTLRFVDFVHIVGGRVKVGGGNKNDYFNFTAVAPASIIATNVGNTGNCNLVDLSGGYNLFNMIIPAAGDGTHDVDLTNPINANLAGPDPIFVGKFVPIPAWDWTGTIHTGFWDWDEQTGELTANAEQKGGFNLFDFEITLSRYVRKHIVYSGQSGVPVDLDVYINHRSGPILPHWRFDIEMTRDSSHSVGDKVYYGFQMILARRKTSV